MRSEIALEILFSDRTNVSHSCEILFETFSYWANLTLNLNPANEPLDHLDSEHPVGHALGWHNHASQEVAVCAILVLDLFGYFKYLGKRNFFTEQFSIRFSQLLIGVRGNPFNDDVAKRYGDSLCVWRNLFASGGALISGGSLGGNRGILIGGPGVGWAGAGSIGASCARAKEDRYSIKATKPRPASDTLAVKALLPERTLVFLDPVGTT